MSDNLPIPKPQNPSNSHWITAGTAIIVALISLAGVWLTASKNDKTKELTDRIEKTKDSLALIEKNKLHEDSISISQKKILQKDSLLKADGLLANSKKTDNILTKLDLLNQAIGAALELYRKAEIYYPDNSAI